MKFTFLLWGLFITLNTFSQSSAYSFNIICKDSTIKKIEVLFIHNDSSFSIRDKTLYTNMLMETNGKIAYPYAIYLRYNDEDRSPILFIEKGFQTLIIDSLHSIIKVQSKKLTNQYYESLSSQKIDTNVYTKLWDLYFKVMRTGYSIQNLQKLSEIRNIIGENETTFAIKKMLQGSTMLQVGKIFPPIELYDLNKKQVNLDFGKSKFTLLDFWFASCGPCIDYFKKLKAIYSTNSSLKIIAISIDMETNKPMLLKTIQKNNYQWENLWDINSKCSNYLNIHSFPRNFLIDSKGKILAINIQTEELKKYF